MCTTYARTAQLTRPKAVDFLYSQTKQNVYLHLPAETARKQIREALRYAIERKKNLECSPDGCIAFGYLIAWAQKQENWLGIFDDFPRTVRVRRARRAPYEPELDLHAIYPDSIAESQSELRRLRDLLGIRRPALAKLLAFAERYPRYRQKLGGDFHLLQTLVDEPANIPLEDIQSLHGEIERTADLLRRREEHLPKFRSLALKHARFVVESKRNGRTGGRGKEKLY